MKKIIIFLCVLTSSFTYAQSVGTVFKEGNLYYKITQLSPNKEVAVSPESGNYNNNTNSYYTNNNNNKPTGDIAIPATITNNGTTYSVKSIGVNTFFGCSGLISVDIPNSVTKIGGNAFNRCSGLTSVSIPNSVTSIGYNAFNGCSGLTSVSIPNSVTSIGIGTFGDCSSLTSINIPNSVTSIGDGAFSGCSGLASVSIPNSVTSIGKYAFSSCSALTSVSIPNSVTSIGRDAFMHCSGLTSVSIPDSVTSIGIMTFYYCSSLTSVSIGNSVTSIGSHAFYGCSSLTNVICKTTTAPTLGSNAFDAINTNANLYIPSGATYTFTGIKATNTKRTYGRLTLQEAISVGTTSNTSKVTLTATAINSSNYQYSKDGKTFTNIGVFDNLKEGIYTFWAKGSNDLITVKTVKVVLSKMGYIFKEAGLYYKITQLSPNKEVAVSAETDTFSNTTNSYYTSNKPTGSIIIPTTVTNSGTTYSVTSIGNHVFEGCSNLTSVSIPNSVTSIGDRAFVNCSALTSVNLGNSVTSIGGSAFFDCSKLTSISIPNSVTSIGYSAFSRSGLTSVSIPNSVTSIGLYTFLGCSSLTSVSIPNSITSIGQLAFYNCSNLTNIICENTTKPTLGNDAFSGINTTLYTTPTANYTFKGINKTKRTYGKLTLQEAISAGTTANTIKITITANATNGSNYQYSKDGKTFTSSNVFDNLEKDRTHTFWVKGNTDLIAVKTVTFDNIWTGATDNNWETASNWSKASVPTATENVVIPAGLTNYPTTVNAVTVNTVTIESGASLKATGNFTGAVTYKRNADFNVAKAKGWHLMASPVVGETYNDAWVTANTIASGTGNNRGISTYATNNDTWSYFQAGNNGTFTNGKGYGIKRADQAGDIHFTGTLNTNNTGVNVVLANTGDRFNLLGNPYTAYINSTTFLNTEASISETKTFWVWNHKLGTNGAYEVKTISDDFKIAPAQGFFVKSNTAGGTFNFSRANQLHNATSTFQRNTSTQTAIKLLVSNEKSVNNYAKIYYNSNATKGFDVGYEGELFKGKGDVFEVFSRLVANDKGINYQVQTLPNSNYENMVIPIGLNIKTAKELSFSITTTNLPNGINVYLEDRLTGEFTNLSAKNYKVNFNSSANGTGRFYLHTSSSALSTETVTRNKNNVSIYASNTYEITISGLQATKAKVEVYSIAGKKVFDTNILSKGLSTIQLPKVAKGLYIVKVNSALGAVSKKVTLN